MRVDINGVRPGSTFESLLKTIGFVVVQWGHCEQSLELIVNTLHGNFGGNSLPRRRRMPRPVSEKVAFLGECAEQLPSLVDFRSRLEALAIDFGEVTQLRHDLVHGALSDEPIKDGVFTFIRLDAHPYTHDVKTFEYDLKRFPMLEATLMKLGATAPKLGRDLFNARP